ncbi:hypothetical protein KKF60_00295 [Patescibacteria group bacterium]|nr:hypothetical protein [Patescibacteria group bacterium]MBU4458338.1 hypothetical protein [Patescibacteria group bacterium]MCG2695907.1 hypothetical protein [Candidatus Portnoybacteria bacterium]
MERKRLTFFILIAVLIGIILGILLWKILSPKLGEGVFYYRLDGNKANLFLLDNKGEGEKIITVAAQEVDLGKYKPPRHSFISPDRRQLVYFKKSKEEQIGDLGNGMIASRIYYDPILVNLKTGTEKKIEQPIDSTSLVFSPDSNSIAWIKEIKDSTYEEIEKNDTKRELWISIADGESPQLLAKFEENVLLLKRWNEDYVYFQGIFDANIKSLGRINIKTKRVEYIIPKGCNTNLTNCQNIEFSPSGKMFLYEIYSKKNDKEITELYLGDFEKRDYKPVLTTDRISDKIWLDTEKGFFYTEQKSGKNNEIIETIHLVDLYKETDNEIYSGSYISQLAFDGSSNSLYFLERSEGEELNMFNIMRLNVKIKEAEKMLTENYNNILIVQ